MARPSLVNRCAAAIKGAHWNEMERYRATTRRHLATSPFKPPVPEPIKEFAPGDRVSHDKLGLGRVTAVEEGVAVLIDFGTTTLRVTAPYALLYRL
jgi:hypothetical protein